MATMDNHNVISPAVALNTQAISSSTTTAGNIIDMQGFESLEFIILAGSMTDGTYTPLIEHGDASNLSDAAAVADDYLYGTEAAAAIAHGSDNTLTRIGYHGNKRYVRLSLVSASVTTGGTLGAVAIKGHPHVAKTA